MIRKGFTLVELLIVVVIIAVLASVAIPKFMDSQRRSLESSVREQIHILRNAIASFNSDTGWWPASLDDLAATSAPATAINGGGQPKSLDASTWHGPYIAGPTIPTQYQGWIQYNVDPPHTGDISCPQPGTDLNGVPYSLY